MLCIFLVYTYESMICMMSHFDRSGGFRVKINYEPGKPSKSDRGDDPKRYLCTGMVVARIRDEDPAEYLVSGTDAAGRTLTATGIPLTRNPW